MQDDDASVIKVTLTGLLKSSLRLSLLATSEKTQNSSHENPRRWTPDTHEYAGEDLSDQYSYLPSYNTRPEMNSTVSGPFLEDHQPRTVFDMLSEAAAKTHLTCRALSTRGQRNGMRCGQ